MRSSVVRRFGACVLTTAAVVCLRPVAAGAVCNPGSCDAVFACGFRECGPVTCETFLEDAGTLCRSESGVCDVAETCTGSSLSCPTNRKKSAATVCRDAVDSCDGAEHCDGSSNDCPPDVGLRPDISSMALLVTDVLNHGVPFPDPFFNIEVLGENLCEVTLDSDVLTSPFFVGSSGGAPATRIRTDRSSPPLTSTVFSVDVNRGAVTGTLPWPFLRGSQDGFIQILSPEPLATVGGDPTFSVSNECQNCDFVRATLFGGPLLLGETPATFALPLDTPTGVGLDDLEPDPGSLPEGGYVVEFEAIVGERDADRGFGGDTSGERFEYLSGASIRNRLDFTVPEPATFHASFVAVAGLAVLARRARAARSAEASRRYGPASSDRRL